MQNIQNETITIPMTAQPLFSRSCDINKQKVSIQPQFNLTDVQLKSRLNQDPQQDTKPQIVECLSSQSFQGQENKTPDNNPLIKTNMRVTRTEVRNKQANYVMEQLEKENSEIQSTINQLQYLDEHYETLQIINNIDDILILNQILQELQVEVIKLKYDAIK
ncbi:hypothetical protein SS50377_22124 [Spironucleus salmonicida]|uniref:Uncharacterized protein n=1 Tax=Spironucleus salmonicida TaxID=348837 RepID=V6LPT0_9EUKA|nr:hypothetical protein SS50377_22124 [Spironucleus salmonicida]|eukprot:EST45716.1 Hypothetical protein SS50377_14287 [Spironucleus salmonicida]